MKILDSLLFRNAFLYAIYCTLVWLVHIFLISTITFFHFLLEHSLGVIEDWIFNKAWQLISISKIIAYYFIFKFISLKTDFNQSFKGFLAKGFVLPEKEVLAVIVLLVGFSLVLGGPTSSSSLNIDSAQMMISFFSIFLFYMTDFMIITFLNREVDRCGTEWKIQVCLLPLIFLFMSKVVFLYGKNITFLMYFNFLFCLFLSDWKKDNWSLPAFFLVLYVCPMGALFGLDPVWGHSFSLFKMSVNLKFGYLIALGFMFIGYLIWKKKEVMVWKR